MKPKSDFGLPPAPWAAVEAAIEGLARVQAAQFQPPGSDLRGVVHPVPMPVVKAVAEIATHLWKARTKMVDSATGEVRDEMRKVFRHVELSLTALESIAVEIKDHTGDSFDYGLPLKVITSQPTEGITKEQVIETLRPTIYWEQQIIQMGEVVIAIPAGEGATS